MRNLLFYSKRITWVGGDGRECKRCLYVVTSHYVMQRLLVVCCRKVGPRTKSFEPLKAVLLYCVRANQFLYWADTDRNRIHPTAGVVPWPNRNPNRNLGNETCNQVDMISAMPVYVPSVKNVSIFFRVCFGVFWGGRTCFDYQKGRLSYARDCSTQLKQLYV